MLEARGLGVELAGQPILRDVGLQVRSGEVLAVLGRNGAGKTTLVRVLAGDLRSATGEVLFDGRRLSAWSPRALARRRAVLSQSSAVTLPFTVRDIVALGRLPHAGPRASHDRAVVLALRRTGLEALADRVYATLSGGEQQRVQFARCLAQLDGPEQAPPLLILDEPVAHLDLAYQHAILAAARDLAGSGAAVLAVLHDLNLAASYADRVALLASGRLDEAGAPDQVLKPARLSAVFGVDVEVVPRAAAPALYAVRGARDPSSTPQRNPL